MLPEDYHIPSYKFGLFVLNYTVLLIDTFSCNIFIISITLKQRSLTNYINLLTYCMLNICFTYLMMILTYELISTERATCANGNGTSQFWIKFSCEILWHFRNIKETLLSHHNWKHMYNKTKGLLKRYELPNEFCKVNRSNP